MKRGTACQSSFRARAKRYALYLGFAALLLNACKPRETNSVKDGSAAQLEHSRPETHGKRWLAATARIAQQEGAEPIRVLSFGSGAPGDVVDAFIFVAKNRCALVYARGSESIEDLDLHAFGDDGTEFGSDEAPDDQPTLMLCPEQDTRIYLTARIAQGHGLLALGLHDLDPVKAMPIARATGARNHSVGPQDVDEPWPGLGATLELHREELGGHWMDQRRVALPVDSRVPTRITVTVPADRCLDALALASDEVARLELLAEDDNGRIFARGRAKGANRSLLFCAGNQSQDIRLVIRPHSGRGLTVLAVSTTRDAQDRLDLNPDVAIEHLANGLTNSQVPALPRPQASTTLALSVGELTSWNLQLKGCSRIDLIPQQGLRGYSARVWNEAGSLLSASRGEWEAPLFVCGSGKARFETEATRTPGSLQVELRESPGASTEFINLPLAASRLLSRMHGAGVLRFPHEASVVSQVVLQESRLHVQEFTLPPGKCLEAFVAKDQEAYGVEARLLDADSGLELAFERGGTSLQVSSCATGTNALTGSLQLRTVRGSARALVAIQVSALAPATSETLSK